LALTVMTRRRSRWSICAGPVLGVMVASWPSGMTDGPPPAAGARQHHRQRRQVGRILAGAGRQPHAHVARLARRVDPVAGVDAGERRPERLGDLPDRDAERAGEPAVDGHAQLGLLTLGRQPHVDGARRGADDPRGGVGQAGERAGVGALQLHLQRLLPAARAAGLERVGRHAGHAPELGPQPLGELALAEPAFGLGPEADVHRRGVDRAGARRAADGGVGVAHLGARAHARGHLLGGQARELEARARRRLDRHGELAAVALRGEAEAAERGLEGDGGDERADRERDHRLAVVEGPGDPGAVAVGLPVEPAVEAVDGARDRVAPLVRLDLRVGPVGREHRVERERHEQRHEHRRRDGQRERLEPLAGEAAHEADRHEHGHDREGGRRHGEADLVGALVRGPQVVLPHLDVATMFSRTTMASSIRMPIASERPSSDMVFSVKPNSMSGTNAASTDTGSARPVITVERHELRKRNTTSTVSAAPSTSVYWTSSTERATRSPASRTTSMPVPAGRPPAAREALLHRVGHGRGAVPLRLDDVEADGLAPVEERGAAALRGPDLDARHRAEGMATPPRSATVSRSNSAGRRGAPRGGWSAR
jgi:hypothetical protein